MTHPTDAQLEVLERARWNARRDRIEDRLCDAVARLRETQTKEMK